MTDHATSTEPTEQAKLNEIFHDAARKGDTETLLDALEKGAMLHSGDKTGWPALSAAGWAGKTETAAALMDRGVDLRATDSNGWTAMHWAAWMGHGDTLNAMLERDETLLHVTDNKGWTLLHRAAAGGHTDVALDLLRRGADFDATTQTGQTALDYAEESGWPDAPVRLREFISLRNAEKTKALRMKKAHKPRP